MISQTSKNLTFCVVIVGLLTLSLVVSAPVGAQVVGATLTGTVTDPSGAVIPNAKVSIQDTATGITRETSVDTAGLYSAPNLLPGTYTVTTSAQGFSTQVHTGITLGVAASQILNISLEVGELNSKVEVTGAAPTVELYSSAVTAEVNATTMRELPLNGRDWTQLATLQPGVIVVSTQASTNSTGNRGSRGFGNELSDSGHTPYQNNYRIDGVSVNDYTNGAPGSVLGVQLGVDAIDEFSVLTTNYPAGYGRASGAVINSITRSGTNQFHGSVYGFWRDKVLDARNFFNPPKIPPFHRNQFGASGGGPIQKDRTFIFFDYEGVRQDSSNALHDTVPTAAARAGNLCSVPQTGGCVPHTITVDALVKPFLGFWPLPNAGLTPNGNGDTGFFNASGAVRLPENYAIARFDRELSSKDSFTATWLYDKATITQPDSLLISNSQSRTLRQMGSLEWTRVFNSAVVNTARFGYSRSEAQIQQPVSAINPLGADTSLGTIPGRNAAQINVTGLTSETGALDAATGVQSAQNSFQVYDDAFISTGPHSLKFGFAFEAIQNNVFNLSAPNGSFTFPSLQNFLTNRPSSAVILDPTFTKEVGLRQELFGFYVQDDWRVRPNLTLNLGLRYEPATLPAEDQGRFAVVQNLFGGSVIQPVQSLWKNNSTLHNFEPRVGLAWDPFHSGKTSVRAAFGEYAALPLPWSYWNATSGSYPFSVALTSSTLPPGSFPTAAVALIPFIPSNITSAYFNQNPGRSYTMNWNLNIQREIVPGLTATVGYVGSHGIRLPWKWQDQNMVLPKLTSAGYLWPFPVGSGKKLNPNVGGISSEDYDSNSSYNGLQAGITKKMGHGVQAQGSYTWGKCIDTSSNSTAADTYTNTLRDPPFFDLQARRGLCDYNVAHVFVGNFIWQAPTPKFGEAVVDYILGGWQLGAIATTRTGTPFTLIMSGDTLGQKSSDPTNFPDRVPGPGCSNPTNPGSVSYLKVNCFTPPIAPASFASVCQPAAPSVAAVIPNTCMNLFGDNGRNSIIGPGLFTFDFSVFKNNYVPKISESFNIQFRAEFFNIFNRANFQSPLNNKTIFNNTGVLVGAAGQIDSTTTTARQIQLGLKIIW
jgi:hypothetical protein